MSGVPHTYGAAQAWEAADYVFWGLFWGAIFGGFIWFALFIKGLQDSSAAQQAYAYAQAHFRPGEIVRSRVANFRGVITDMDCYRGCEYRVRFVVGSMQPVWVEETEIVAAP